MAGQQHHLAAADSRQPQHMYSDAVYDHEQRQRQRQSQSQSQSHVAPRQLAPALEIVVATSAPSISRAPMPTGSGSGSGSNTSSAPKRQTKRKTCHNSSGENGLSLPHPLPLPLPPSSPSATSQQCRQKSAKKRPVMSTFSAPPPKRARGNSGRSIVAANPMLLPMPAAAGPGKENPQANKDGLERASDNKVSVKAGDGGNQHLPSLMDAALGQGGDKKMRLLLDDSLVDELDASLPPDEGIKPKATYTLLITIALLRAPDHRLKLQEIYAWIASRYTWFATAVADASGKIGWQNSVRHNLSLHPRFLKIDPKSLVKDKVAGTDNEAKKKKTDDGGKGCFWTLVVDEIRSRELDILKPRWVSCEDDDPVPPPASSALGSAHQRPEPSSDATIALSSDQAAPACSPSPAALDSSPPLPRYRQSRSGTPALRRHDAPSPTRAGRQKRKFGESMDAAVGADDAGYMAVRACYGAYALGSDFDRPRIKRGRAEEEIARIRASAYESPTKAPSYGRNSSPYRSCRTRQTLPPLTPGVRLRPMSPAPPSLSPMTQLDQHRARVNRMLESPIRRIPGSPLRHDSLFEMPYSPAFHLTGDTPYCYPGYQDYGPLKDSPEPDVFRDGASDIFLPARNASSPTKRSTQAAARMERSNSTGALDDVTNVSPAGRRAGIEDLDPSLPVVFRTPNKFADVIDSPSRVFRDPSPRPVVAKKPAKEPPLPPLPAIKPYVNVTDFNDFLPEFVECQGDGIAGGGGLDILQDFERIGGGGGLGAPFGSPARPGLGRASTSNF